MADYSITRSTTSPRMEDDMSKWMLDRLEDGDIEAIREHFDYNTQKAYELGYTKEDLKNIGIFDEEGLEEEDDSYDSDKKDKALTIQ